MGFLKYLWSKSEANYAKDIKLYMAPTAFCSSIAELNPSGMKACVIYRKWVHYILTEVTEEFGGVLTEELAREILEILRLQLLKAMQPIYIANEMRNPQHKIH